MCGFSLLEMEREGKEESVGWKLLYRVSVVDLDPKSPKNIPSYYHLDQKITSIYSSLSSSPETKPNDGYITSEYSKDNTQDDSDNSNNNHTTNTNNNNILNGKKMCLL